MAADPNNADDPEVLSEEAVRRLLTRASELEAARSTQLSTAELREIAREVGIAPSSFEQALTELRNRALHPDAEARSLETKKSSRFKTATLGALVTLGALGAAYFLLRMLVS
jgi:transposase-like protein